MSGGGRWTDSKDGTESASSTSQSASSWNIDIFVDVVKELVRSFLLGCKPQLLIYSSLH